MMTIGGACPVLIRCTLLPALLILATPARAESDSSRLGKILLGFQGGPTPYLQGVKEMVWELSVIGNCNALKDDNLRSAATFTLNASGLRFVNWGELLKMGDTPNVRNRLNQPNLRLGIKALAVGSACFADIDAHVEVAIEGGHFLFNKQPLGPAAGMNIWYDAGEMISAPSNEIEGRASQALDRIIKRFANAWVASQPR